MNIFFSEVIKKQHPIPLIDYQQTTSNLPLASSLVEPILWINPTSPLSKATFFGVGVTLLHRQKDSGNEAAIERTRPWLTYLKVQRARRCIDPEKKTKEVTLGKVGGRGLGGVEMQDLRCVLRVSCMGQSKQFWFGIQSLLMLVVRQVIERHFAKERPWACYW